MKKIALLLCALLLVSATLLPVCAATPQNGKIQAATAAVFASLGKDTRPLPCCFLKTVRA
jgi:hypothetical protein